MEYKIVSSSHTYQVEMKINDLAKEGWEVKTLAVTQGNNYVVIMQRLT
jgi:Domain of unknown function (DUF4177)